MRAIYFLLICAWATLNIGNACSQSFVQKRYGNEKYKIYGWATPNVDITNTRNTLHTEDLAERCDCDPRWMKMDSTLLKIMLSVFPLEKRKALAATSPRKYIIYLLYYDAATGQILNVEFGLWGVTLSEEKESLTAASR